jgi:hypothetical protein
MIQVKGTEILWKHFAYAKLTVIAEIVGPILCKVKKVHCTPYCGINAKRFRRFRRIWPKWLALNAKIATF